MAALGKIATAKVPADFCNRCDNLVPLATLNCDGECRDCSQSKCSNCNNEVDNDERFCSSCHYGYWAEGCIDDN